MKKVTFKIMFASFIIMIIASLLPRILLDVYDLTFHSVEVDARLFLIGGFVSVFTAISLFILFMEKVILKRIRSLNEATREVMNGNYDFSLEMKQKDELSELTNNFNRMVKELQSNEYLNKEFIRNISHELKTPLSAIHGYAELINTSDLTIEEIKEYSQIISLESKRMSLLAKDILQISLVESQSILQQCDLFKISEQIRNVIQVMQLEWENKKIEFELNLEEINSCANKEVLYLVWTNLISNAIKFSDDNSEIKILLTKKDNDAIFTITNPGIINDEEKEKVFNLFYVSQKSKNRDSNGVGLTLVSKIINKLNGTISLTSNDGYVTFVVTIPNKQI